MRYQQTLQCVYKYNSLTPPDAHREVCFGGQLFKHCLGGLSEEIVCSPAQSELLALWPSQSCLRTLAGESSCAGQTPGRSTEVENAYVTDISGY